jgi:hypothetical protein
MTRRGGHEERVPATMADVIRVLTHLENVCVEEGVIMLTKVRAALAHIRVWCRDIGGQHRRAQPRP